MQLIDNDLLNEVSRMAAESQRLRMNYNFHESLDSKAQRLLNALEPGTIVPIHRHQATAETYILLRGRLKVIFYNDDKSIIDEAEIDPAKGVYGIHIPKGQWHTIEVLEHGSVIFEVKDGPYAPLDSDNILK